MDLSLASPVWWVSVLLASLLIGSLSPLLLDRLARRRLSEQVERAPAASAHQLTSLLAELRLRLWVCTLLCVANLAMLVVLAVANLRVPQLAGPVGLAFVVLCLSTLTLAWQVHRAIGRLGRDLSSRKPGSTE